MNMTKIPLIAAISALLAACGGGGSTPTSSVSNAGGSNGTGGNSTSIPVPAGTTLATPDYAAGSAKEQILAALNAARVQCGFPAFRENSILNKAAQNHADYMLANGTVITDAEVSGNAGFTGVTGQDRANAQGWPAAIGAGTANAGAIYTNAVLTQAQYGQSIVDAWSVGVYHQVVIASTTTLVGVGLSQTTYNGFPQALGGVELGYDGSTPPIVTGTGPLTFPCQGTSGVPYKGLNEIPAPPGTAGSWGTPVTITGNVGDTISLSAATMTSPTGMITLQILNSDTDPAKLVARFQAVAYPTSPLQPNTTYTVNLSGTYNGAAFSRSFTFTTSNVAA